MKLLIVGHGEHGKDSAAAILQSRLKLSFCSSSWFAMMQAVWPVIGHEYPDSITCFLDRRNRREEWHQLIKDYNTPDLARLQRELLAEFDVYVGLRDAEEYQAGKHLYDHIIYVDAGQRCPPDPSMHILYNPTEMLHIDNSGAEMWFYKQLMGLELETA